jgi:hypothetical protein
MSEAECLQNSNIVLLPEFVTDGRLIGNFSSQVLNARISKKTSELLRLVSLEQRRVTFDKKRQLVILYGRDLPKDPSTDQIRKGAEREKLYTPTIEDALYLAKNLSRLSFNELNVDWLAIMHNPLKGHVIVVLPESQGKALAVREVEPIKGWYALKGGFVFSQNI